MEADPFEITARMDVLEDTQVLSMLTAEPDWIEIEEDYDGAIYNGAFEPGRQSAA